MHTAEENRQIEFEINHFRNFRTSVTLYLDRVIRHTIVYHSSTSTYTPNFTQIGKLFVDERTRMYKRADERRGGWMYVGTGFSSVSL